MNLSENFKDEIFSENLTRMGDLRNVSTGCDEFCQEYSEKMQRLLFKLCFVEVFQMIIPLLFLTPLTA